MKTLNITRVSGARQGGFTIIELIVVILLLGILTATALPRFLDVTDDAHQSVVDAIEGGMLTGLALFRAGYIAEGQDNASQVSSFGAGDLYPDNTSDSGYPVGTADDTLDDETDCLAVYNSLLQSGRPTAASAAFDAVPATLESNIEAVSGPVDIVATAGAAASPTTCVYYYVGQFKSGTAAATAGPIQTLTYDVTTGSITEGTFTFQN